MGSIVGPVDALDLLSSRQQLTAGGAQLSESVPADVFVFSLGEPADRSETKIGGLPYLAEDEEWPGAEWEEPLPFVAQLNFSQSQDLFDFELPGSVLLIFADIPADLEDFEYELIWTHPSDRPLIPQPEVESPLSCFAGKRWRTENFLHPRYEDLPEELTEMPYSPETTLNCLATQIGRAPFGGSSSPMSAGTIVASVLPVVPSDTPYPFLDHPDAVTHLQYTSMQAGTFQSGGQTISSVNPGQTVRRPNSSSCVMRRGSILRSWPSSADANCDKKIVQPIRGSRIA
ncbi:MAG: YwqG family protein [Planctomycetaceae bacterium]|nr:YwqG family protein [Planctomycetaceae bacterium]